MSAIVCTLRHRIDASRLSCAHHCTWFALALGVRGSYCSEVQQPWNPHQTRGTLTTSLASAGDLIAPHRAQFTPKCSNSGAFPASLSKIRSSSDPQLSHKLGLI